MQILANALAEATPTPIAHEEPHCPGFEPTFNPSHAHRLARRPDGTSVRTLPFPSGPVSQAFLSSLSRFGHSATFLSFIKSKTGFSGKRLKSGFSKSTDAQVSLDPVQIIIANPQDTYFSNYPTFLTPLVRLLI